MTTKKLRAQLEALEAENGHLGEELRRFTEARNGREEPLADAESSVLLEVQRQATEDLQAELTECQERNVELEQLNDHLQARLQQLTTDAELETLRAVDQEKAKWEAPEERLVRQLESLQQKLASTTMADMLDQTSKGDPSCDRTIQTPEREVSEVSETRGDVTPSAAASPPRSHTCEYYAYYY